LLVEGNTKMRKVLLIVILLLVLTGCEEKEEYIHLFSEGQFVTHKLSGLHGQILRVSQLSYKEYRVRLFYPQSQTNTRLLSSDDPITYSPLSADWYKEFELESYVEAK